MFFKKQDSFVITTLHAMKGGLTGLVCGIVFFYLIALLSSVLPAVSGAEAGMPPIQVAMIGGSLLGAVLGGMVGMRASR